MGVITMPFSRLVVRWYSWISDQVMAKENNTEFLFSGRWLDKSNKGASFSSLSCPAMARSCVGVAPQKFRWDNGIIFHGLAGALENCEI